MQEIIYGRYDPSKLLVEFFADDYAFLEGQVELLAQTAEDKLESQRALLAPTTLRAEECALTYLRGLRSRLEKGRSTGLAHNPADPHSVVRLCA